MKRILLAFCGVIFAGIVQAQVCDVTLSSTEYYKGKIDATITGNYYGLSAEDVALVHEQALAIIDAASKEQDKKDGSYTVELSETKACDGGKPQPTAGVMVQGVTAHGVTKINRAAVKAGDKLAKIGEDRADKGKKKLWGKE